jgi:hypothetical protein
LNAQYSQPLLRTDNPVRMNHTESTFDIIKQQFALCVVVLRKPQDLARVDEIIRRTDELEVEYNGIVASLAKLKADKKEREEFITAVNQVLAVNM